MTKTRPHTHDSSAVPAMPQIKAPISNPTSGMTGMFATIAGLLMPL